MVTELLAVIAPVFVCAGIGYVWARLGHSFDAELVTTLITSIGAPCLIFATLVQTNLNPAAFATMVFAAVTSIAVFAAVGVTILKATGLSVRGFLPSLMFPNAGNMGLPLCLLAFGQEGLALAIAYFTVLAVVNFTVGVAVASGTVSPRRLLQIPLLYAVAAALIFMLSGIAAPTWLVNTTDLIGGMTIPLMLITLGISLARLQVRGLKTSLALAFVRLGVGFLTGLAVSAVFDLQGLARGVMIVQSSMPAAVFSYLFAQRYKTAPEEVAGLVVISTILAFLLLPLLMWFVMAGVA